MWLLPWPENMGAGNRRCVPQGRAGGTLGWTQSHGNSSS